MKTPELHGCNGQNGEPRGQSPLITGAVTDYVLVMEKNTQTHNPLYPLTPQQVRILLAKLAGQNAV